MLRPSNVRASSAVKFNPQEDLYDLPLTPFEVDLDNLDEEGNLIGTNDLTEKDKIIRHAQTLKNNQTVRLPRRALQKDLKLEKKPRHGFISSGNAENVSQKSGFWLLSSKTIGKGRSGKIKLANKVKTRTKDAGDSKENKTESGKWFISKIVSTGVKDPTHDTVTASSCREFEIATKMGQAETIILQRPSPKYDNTLQNEILIQHCPGQDLRQILSEENPRPLKPIFWMERFRGMIEQVMKLHQLRYLHRDIKPENFMILGALVTLIDFGISRMSDIPVDPKHPKPEDAKLSVTDDTEIGTFEYMDPEILIYKNFTFVPEMDIYSLGIIMAECLDFLTPESRKKWSQFNEKLNEFGIDYLCSNEGFPVYQAALVDNPRLVKDDSDEFKSNRIIPDKTLRLTLLNLISQMIGKKEERPTLEECYSKISTIISDLEKSTELHVCLINITEYISASPEQKAKIRQNFQSDDSDRLWFIANKRHSEKELITVIREFGINNFHFMGKKIINMAGKKENERQGILESAAKIMEPGKKISFSEIFKPEETAEEYEKRVAALCGGLTTRSFASRG